jgi:hypothetical protein
MKSKLLGPRAEVEHFDEGALIQITRKRVKSGSREVSHKLRMGPNKVHAFVSHPDGSIFDCGISENLLTNIGDMVVIGNLGGAIPAGGSGSPATATSATSITATATPWTASNLATPQLGLAGFRVYAPVTGLTTAPVYGNIVSNTTSVATIDQWWTATDTVGTTPASTNAFIIGAGGFASARFIALTTNSGAASATDTALTGEITSGGCGRALGTFARGSNPSGGSGSFTLTKAFSVTSTFTAIHKAGLFCCLTSAGADPMVLETVLNVDATVANGDTLTLTWSITQAG